jgi:flagellar biosynthesis protein FlhF
MRVKRYVADSLQEAIARVKADLGRNAIILHTKQFKEGGMFGFFAQNRYEVIAALDENPTPGPGIKMIDKPSEAAGEVRLVKAVTAPAETAFLQQQQPAQSVATVAQRRSTSVAASAPQPSQSQPPKISLPLTPQAVSAAGGVEPALNSLRAEMQEMKELIREAATVKPKVIIKERLVENGPGSELREQLHQLGLEPEVIYALLDEIAPEMLTSWPLPELLHYCRQWLASRLMFSEPLETGPQRKQQVITLIGPTGVGKTTTIAKLAAKFNLFEGKKVGLITLDTYRIAAVEHLKTYGDIMNLPVEVVYAPADLEPAIANLRFCDVILVDTAGRSPRNQMMMDELHNFIAKPVIETILLVISATTQYQDMVSIEEKFARIAYTHLVFTKLDETANLGPLVSLAWKCKRPISYLAAGQNVPDDIETAHPDKLIAQLFKGLSNG